MHTDESKKFDKRNIERNVRDGIITTKDYETYLAKLPDVSDKTFDPDGPVDESMDVVPEKEGETHGKKNGKKKGLKKKGKAKGN